MLISRRKLLMGALTLAGGTALIGRPFAQETAPVIAVKKDPWCGCCTGWALHLEQAGFSVDVENIEEMEKVKDALSVPADLRSCHTATVDGYVIEGHVPAEAITALLEDRPKITGLAVPGMPLGSPGMEGPDESSYETYEVLAFDGERREVFMRFVGQSRA